MMAGPVEDIVIGLRSLADRQRLVQRAQQTCVERLRAPGSPWPIASFGTDVPRTELCYQALVFEGDAPIASPAIAVPGPVLLTVLDLYVDLYQVGYFKLATRAGGEVAGDHLEVYEDYRSGGRAVPLMEAVVQRLGTGKHEWVGLVHIMPKAGTDCLGGAIGAFTNVVALATDQTDCRRLIEYALRNLGLEPQEYEDLQPLADRLAIVGVPDDTLALATQLSEADLVLFDTFHTYETDECE